MELLDLDDLPCLHPTPTVWCPSHSHKTRGLGLADCVILYCNPEDARTGTGTGISPEHEPITRTRTGTPRTVWQARRRRRRAPWCRSGLHQTSLCCSCFGLTGQELQACSPACYQAYRARTRSSLCRREQSTSAARAVFFVFV